MAAEVTQRDWHGLSRHYRREGGAVESSSLLALATDESALDLRGVQAAWGQLDAPDHTVFADVRQLPCGHGWKPAAAGDLTDVLYAAVEHIAATAANPAIALGGGLDAAVVLAIWKQCGYPVPPLLTIETGLAVYDEVDEARAIATACGAQIITVQVPPDEVLAILGDAVTACETPLYNLHPVVRLALARAARASGFDTLVTGDGADAVFAGVADYDYVPLMSALTRAANVALVSPFFTDEVVSAALAAAPSSGRDKAVLRGIACELGLPEWLVDTPKKSRMFPALDLSKYWRAKPTEALGDELELPVCVDSDRDRVGWLTLDQLLSQVRGRS
jgi:asparagine synthase (glutamine-hydrolysing)